VSHALATKRTWGKRMCTRTRARESELESLRECARAREGEGGMDDGKVIYKERERESEKKRIG